MLSLKKTGAVFVALMLYPICAFGSGGLDNAHINDPMCVFENHIENPVDIAGYRVFTYNNSTVRCDLDTRKVVEVDYDMLGTGIHHILVGEDWEPIKAMGEHIWTCTSNGVTFYSYKEKDGVITRYGVRKGYIVEIAQLLSEPE